MSGSLSNYMNNGATTKGNYIQVPDYVAYEVLTSVINTCNERGITCEVENINHRKIKPEISAELGGFPHGVRVTATVAFENITKTTITPQRRPEL